MKRIFVCSPLRGDMEKNMERASQYCRQIAQIGNNPFAPHLLYPQFLVDSVPEEREFAMACGRDFLQFCDEVWVFGMDSPSEGMAAEIEMAKAMKIPVKDGFKFIKGRLA